MQRIFLSILDKIQILSLDICLGTWGGAALALHMTKAPLPLLWLYLLPIATWGVYTVDHLLDAQRIGPSAHTARHAFHYRHQTVLWKLVIGVFGFIGGLCFSQKAWALCMFGGVMGGVVMGYFFLLRQAVWTRAKEFGVALIYTLGIWGMPMWYGRHLQEAWIGMGLFFLTVYLNLISYAVYDFEVDKQDLSPSLATDWTLLRAKQWGVGVLALFLFGWTLWVCHDAHSRSAQGLLLTMALGTALMLPLQKLLKRHTVYRFWGEALFYLPLIVYRFRR